RVAAVGGADRAHRRRSPDARGELRVADGLAVGDRGQAHPDRALESGALRRQRQLEAAPTATEILFELRARLAQQRTVALAPVVAAADGVAVVAELDRAQALRIGR